MIAIVGLVAGLSFFVTYFSVPLVQKLANTVGLIDAPDGKIKRHQAATPYLGGVAVYLGFIVGAFVAGFYTGTSFYSLLAGLTILLLVGLLDDAISLSPTQKFIGQMIAAACFLYTGIHLKAHFLNNNVNWVVSFLWILTVANAINLVDVMDGLATTLSFWVGFGFLCVSFNIGNPFVTLMLISFLGALGAFFLYNKPIASIYLGDAGALFIGGFLAAIPFSLRWGTYTPYGYLAPVILLAIPLLEVVSLIFIRRRKNIPFYNGSPDHYVHYLEKKKWSRWSILGLSSLFSLILVITSLLFVLGIVPLWRIGIYGILFVLVWIRIYR